MKRKSITKFLFGVLMGIILVIIVHFLCSCEKEEGLQNASQATTDSLVVWKQFSGAVTIEIDGVNTTWWIEHPYTTFPPFNGYPEHKAYKGKHYKAWFKESTFEYVLIEEGYIGQVTIIDGISWN